MKKTRFFTCMVYDDKCSRDDLISNLENWDFIKGFAVSPLHVDTSNHHWHIVVRTCEESSIDNIRNHCRNEIPDLVHNNVFQPVKNIDSIINYLTHANDKNKTHYDVKDCFVQNFPQAKKILEGYAKQRYMSDVLAYIESGDFKELWSFFHFLACEEDISSDFVSWCVAHGNLINQLITSRRYLAIKKDRIERIKRLDDQ